MSDALEKTRVLIEEAQRGSDRAANELFARFTPQVWKIVRLGMGRKLRRRMESMDLVQETLAEAFQNLDRFEYRYEGSFVRYLARLAERRILHAAEREGAAKRDVKREVPLAPPAPLDHSAPPEFDHLRDSVVPLDQAIQRESQEAVAEALADLKPQYREFLILRNFLGLPFKEVARQTGSPSDGAARMMHAKAGLELKRILERRGHAAPED